MQPTTALHDLSAILEILMALCFNAVAVASVLHFSWKFGIQAQLFTDMNAFRISSYVL
jgi:hypothetical protein